MGKTSGLNNRGIMHLSWSVGGQPLCGSRRALMSTTPDRSQGWTICRRCEARLSRSKAKTRPTSSAEFSALPA